MFLHIKKALQGSKVIYIKGFALKKKKKDQARRKVEKVLIRFNHSHGGGGKLKFQ